MLTRTSDFMRTWINDAAFSLNYSKNDKHALMTAVTYCSQATVLEFIKRHPEQCYPNLITYHSTGDRDRDHSVGDQSLLIGGPFENRVDVNKDGNTAFMVACKKGMVQVAIALINTFPNKILPEHTNKKGETALIITCNNMQLAAVAIKLIDLFGEQCRPGATTIPYGGTALMYALCNNMDYVANKMIDQFGKKCNISQRTTPGNMSAFHHAVASPVGAKLALKMLDLFGVEVCQVNTASTDRTYLLPIHTVISFKDKTPQQRELITKLVQLVNPGTENSNNSTILLSLCANKLWDDAKWLITQHGDACCPEKPNKFGDTAFIYAVENCSVMTQMINAFGEKCMYNQINQSSVNAFVSMCFSITDEIDDIKLFDTFMEKCGKQCNIGQVDKRGQTGLLGLCSNIGKKEISLSCNNKRIYSFILSVTFKIVILKILREYPLTCALEQKDYNHDRSALWYACRYGALEIVEMMNTVMLENYTIHGRTYLDLFICREIVNTKCFSTLIYNKSSVLYDDGPIELLLNRYTVMETTDQHRSRVGVCIKALYSTMLLFCGERAHPRIGHINSRLKDAELL